MAASFPRRRWASCSNHLMTGKSEAKRKRTSRNRETSKSLQPLSRSSLNMHGLSPNEYMAWITGVVEQDPKLKKKICYAQGLFIPLQNGNSWNVVESDNALGTGLVEYLESTNSVVVGWIHSHPTFESFFSSIDQHMQFRLQNESDLAFGLVIDKHKKVRCMRLSPAGMEEVRNCPNNLQDPHIFIPHSLVFCFRAIYRHQHHYLSKFNKHIQV